MFALVARFGALADRLGPRFFMGGGPLVAAVGLAVLRVDADPDYVADRSAPPARLSRSGLAMTVAPLTATVLADADESNAGWFLGVNNAIARGSPVRDRRRRRRRGRVVRVEARGPAGQPGGAQPQSRWVNDA